MCESFLCDLCGSYFTERKFCWDVPVRTALCLSYIHSFSYCSVLLPAFLSDTKDRGPPVQSQTWRSNEKMPFGQAHSLRAFEKPPLVQTQALRDFEKVRRMCGSFWSQLGTQMLESGLYKNMIDRPYYELGCHDGDPFKSVCALSMCC